MPGAPSAPGALYAHGMASSDTAALAGPRDRGLWTVPNAISAVRLLCVPWFLWLLFGAERRIAAVVLLAVLGASDWVDGYIARHFDQGSEVGKILDPTADRILLLAGVVALLVDGSVPVWVGIVILVRELAISAAALALAAAGARRIDVQWVGKAGTLALMFALPAFLLADTVETGRTVLLVGTWGFTVAGLVLSYVAAAGYVPLAMEALREGRAARRPPDDEEGEAA